MLLCVSDLHPIVVSSCSQFPQMSPNASCLQTSAHAARSVCTALPSTLLPPYLASTYSSFQTQFKDHFIHSSTHSLLQPTLMEDSPYARTHTGEQYMVPVLTKLIIKSSTIGTYSGDCDHSSKHTGLCQAT